MSHRNQARSARARRPLLETLEDRTCLSCNVALGGDGHTLWITGSDGDLPNLITITQDDAANNLHVVVQRAPGSPASSCDRIFDFKSSLVTRVAVKTGVGDDQFYYNVVGDDLYQKDLQVNLGAGNNTAVFNMDGQHNGTADSGNGAFFGVDPVPNANGVTLHPGGDPTVVSVVSPVTPVEGTPTGVQPATGTGVTLLNGGDPTVVSVVSPVTPVEGTPTGVQPATGTAVTVQNGGDPTVVSVQSPVTPVEGVPLPVGPQLVTAPSTISAKLNIVIETGSGNDTVDAYFGNIAAGARVSYQANLGAGDDASSATVTGDIAKGAYVSIGQDGGAGNDKLIFDGGEGTVNAGAVLAVYLNGGNKPVGNGIDKGNDNLVANYAGTVNGVMKVSADGGAGNDVIDGTVILGESSTGFMSVSAMGNAGNDTITMIVQSSGPSAHTTTFIDGGAGTDTVIASGTAKPTIVNAENSNFTKT